MSDNDLSNDVALARRAANGSVEDRKIIIKQIGPVIDQKTEQFCKKHCSDNWRRYVCTLFPNRGSREKTAPLCEWGNASYEWMLHDLTKPSRLLTFDGRGETGLMGYLGTIAKSGMFFERWKDWRWGRRVRVPVYIDAINPIAGKVYLLRRDEHDFADIAQRLNQSLAEIEHTAKCISIALTRRSRLYLLNPPKEQSLTGLGQHDNDDASSQEQQGDIADMDATEEQMELQRIIRETMNKLSPEEQFVLEAMVIDGLGAKYVLEAFCTLGISIRKGIAPEDTTLQQLFHFKRKTVGKLAEMSGLIETKSNTKD